MYALALICTAWPDPEWRPDVNPEEFHGAHGIAMRFYGVG